MVSVVSKGLPRNSEGQIELSNSKIDTWFDCKRKFFYVYVLGKSGTPDRRLRLGSYIHAQLEFIYKWLVNNNDGLYTDIPTDVLNVAIGPTAQEIEEDDITLLSQAATVTARYVRRWMPKADKHIQVLMPEQSFWMPLQTPSGVNFLLEVHLDLLFMDILTQTIWEMDHKSGRLWEADDAYWDRQQSIYLLVLRKMMDIPVKGYVINSISTTQYKREGGEPDWKLFKRVRSEKKNEESEAFLTALMATIEEMAWESRFPMNIGKHCRYCPFREVCQTELGGHTEDAVELLSTFDDRNTSGRIASQEHFQKKFQLRAVSHGS